MAKKKGVIAQSLDNSVKDAASHSVMEGAGDNFISPFAIAMNANPFQISLLTSLTSLLAPWFQLYANKLMKTRSRKFIVSKAVLFHALMWLPLASIPFIFKTDFFRSWSVVIVFVVLATIGGFAGPVWNSWMGDLIKREEKPPKRVFSEAIDRPPRYTSMAILRCSGFSELSGMRLKDNSISRASPPPAPSKSRRARKEPSRRSFFTGC